MKTKVLDRQSIFDLAVQTAGSAEAAFDLCLANDKSPTDNLEVGEELLLTGKINKAVSDFYNDKRLKPATGGNEVDRQLDGIDFMGIEFDFIVS